MNEIIPGVFHWTARHPNIGVDVSSYYLRPERVLIDPMKPDDGLDWFRENGPPEHALLSNRHHYRNSADFGCAVHASSPGMHEFTGEQHVQPFDFGDELPGGVKAYEAGAICPDDTAFYIPAHSALSVADGVINYGGLGFVPEEHLGDDVETTKQAIRDSYARIANELEFDNLLLAHGDPIVGGAREKLLQFADG